MTIQRNLRAVHIFARLCLYEARAHRLSWIAGALILGAYGVAQFMASAAVTEAALTRALAYASLARIGVALLLAAFIITSIIREQNDRVLEVFLTQPVPRISWLMGRALGGCMLAWSFASMAGLGAISVAPWASVWPWTLSLGLELSLVALAALTAAIALKRIDVGVLAVGLFYALARTVAGFVGIAQSVGGVGGAGGPGAEAVPLTPTQRVAEWVLSALAHVLPPLDRFAPSAWLAYGPQDSLAVQHSLAGVLLAQSAHTAAFAALLLAVAAFDLYRRNV